MNNPSLTFEALLEQISADDDLSSGRKANVSSAIRSFVKATGKTPQMPASFITTRAGLAVLGRGGHGLSSSRLANIRSDLKFALERYGAPDRAPMRSDLSPAWAILRDAVNDDPHFVFGLSRLMHWASARGIEPGRISDTVLERFRSDLEDRTFASNTKAIHRGVCRLWNRAAKVYEAWPQVTVSVPWYRRQISFSWEAFPASFLDDLDRYCHFMSGDDIFADNAPTPRRLTTLQCHREQFRRFASLLVRAGIPMEEITELSVLIRPDNIKAALEFYQEWLGGDLRSHPSVFEMVGTLRVLGKEYVRIPEDHFRIIDNYCKRLRSRKPGFTAKNRERLRPFGDPQVRFRFLNLGSILRKEALKLTTKPFKQALIMELALAHEIELIAPLRLKNLAQLHLEKNFRWQGTKKRPQVILTIPPDDVKNRQPLDYQLTEPIVRQIREYLKTYRPRLISGEDGGWLFPGALSGQPKHKVTLSGQLVGAVQRHVGVRINVHLYRHLAGYFYLGHSPGDYETVRRLLGHTSVATTMTFYAEFDGLFARRRYAGLLDDMRRDISAKGNHETRF